jgi:peptidoglycan hydrolase-like protein with peptidoglycan-binding domain
MAGGIERDRQRADRHGRTSVGVPQRSVDPSPTDASHAAPEPLTTTLQRWAGNRAVATLMGAGPGVRAEGPTRAGLRARASVTGADVVSRVLAGTITVQRAVGPLTPAQEKTAVAFNRGRYDVNSIRVIQVIVGTKVDGNFGPVSAQAVATFQQGGGIGATGQVDQPTLDRVVARCVTNGQQDYGIYAAANFFGINTRAGALTVSFASGQATAGANKFEAGGLRVITLGPTALTNSAKIRDSINAQLAVPAPAAAAPGPTPNLLTPKQVKTAIAFDKQRLRDPRSVRAIQAFIGATPDGLFSADTVQRIANFQNGAGLTEDGQIGRITANPLVMGMVGTGDRNSAIRTIVDFFKLDENGLVDIHFSSSDGNNATTTDQAIPGNSAITIGPSAFAQGWAGLVHTIAHEYEHVRQNRVGIADLPISEFLGERVEILSRGMDEEDLAGFMDDARRALTQWNLMPAAQRRANFAKFVEVRNKVRARLAAAAKVAPLSAPNAATLAGYNAVVKP